MTNFPYQLNHLMQRCAYLGVLVFLCVPSSLELSLVVALDLAGLGVDGDLPGGDGHLHVPLAAARLGQLVAAAHSVLALLDSKQRFLKIKREPYS